MTHFIGAVIVPEKPDFTKQMTKYPQLYGDQFDVSVDESTRTALEEILHPFYEGKWVERWVTREELIADVRESHERYRTEGSYSEYLELGEQGYREKYPHASEAHFRYVAEEFPQKLAWTDDQCYEDAKRWYGQVNSDGSALDTYNPLSKWDWWTVGGRWEKVYRDIQGETVQAYRDRLYAAFDEYRELGEQAYREKYPYGNPLIPSVLVANGQWVEIGNHGWFGLRDDQMSEKEFWENALVATEGIEGHIVYIDFHI